MSSPRPRPRGSHDGRVDCDDVVVTVRVGRRPARRRGVLDFVIGPFTSRATPPPEPTVPTVILPTDQKATVTLAPKDAFGNPGAVDTSQHAPVWGVSDPALLSVTPAADGLSAVFVAVGPVTASGAVVQGTVRADVDLGEGVEDLVGTVDFQVVAGKVVDLGPSVAPLQPR
jgi:hypothetical protein